MGVIWTSRTRTRQPTRFARADTGRLPITHLWSGSAGVGTFIPDAAGTAHGTKGTLAAGQGYYIKPAGDSVVIEFDTSVGGANSQIINLGDSSGNGGPRRLTAFTLFMEFMVPSIDQAVFYSSESSGLQFSLEPGGILNLVNSNVIVIGVASTAVAAANVWHKAAVSYDGTNYQFVLNGAEAGSGSHSVTISPVQQYFGGLVSGGSYGAPPNGSKLKTFAIIDKVCSVEEMRQLCVNPWQLFIPERRPVFFSLGGGGSTVTGAGSSNGVGIVSGVGESTSAQVGSSSGSGTASGVGAPTANSVGSSTGTGTASGVGSSAGGSGGVGSAAGTGTATGVGASTAASLGSTAGVGTASGVGASTAASTGSASGTGTASGVGTNGSVVSTGVGSASGTGTATGISPTVSQGGGKTTGKNLSRKQRKKLKAVESQEWLKAEETARQLLSDRFTKQTPQEKAQVLETYIESLQPVIEALKALTEPLKEETIVETVVELTPHQEILNRFDSLERKLKLVEELVIILMADL